MADEENKDVVEEPKDKTKSLVMMMIVFAVLMMVLTPFITIMVFKALKPPEKKELASDDSGSSTQTVLKDIMVNLADEGATRFVSCSVAFKLKNKDMAPYFEPPSEEFPVGMGDEIRAEVNLIIGSRTVNNILTSSDKENLAKEIKAGVMGILELEWGRSKDVQEQSQKWTIHKVFFPKFVIQ